MENGSRLRIATHLAATPGASTRMVAQALMLDESTVDYHLRRMRRDGEALRERQGREVCWFVPKSGLCPVLRRAVPAFRRAETARLALALDETPRTCLDLSARAGLTYGQARWSAAVLEQAGLARRTRQGRFLLAEGARLCVDKAARTERCDLWGSCPASRARPNDPAIEVRAAPKRI